MILGVIIKSFQTILGSGYPLTLRISFGEIVSSIRQMKIPTFCDGKARKHRASLYTYDNGSDQYDDGTKDIVFTAVKDTLEASMRPLEDGLRDITLGVSKGKAGVNCLIQLLPN